MKQVPGIVTLVLNDGFFFQSSIADDKNCSSEGLYVYSKNYGVEVGDSILVDGVVEEYIPGGIESNNLSITQISLASVHIISHGHSLPQPTIIGRAGRNPPSKIIDDDRMWSFDSENDGLDFYESLEGMLVEIQKAVVVGATNDFQEIVVLADLGIDNGPRSESGGIIYSLDDPNPERIILDGSLKRLPDVRVGDIFSESILGVMDYDFGNYRVLVKQFGSIVQSDLSQAVVPPPNDNELTVTTYNVDNLSPEDSETRFDTLAGQIIENLQSPDILGLEEIQDNSGSVDDGTVSADVTMQLLTDAIKQRGGPAYEYRQIDPIDNSDGGARGGNIRSVLLFRSDRGLRFIDSHDSSLVRSASIIENQGQFTLSNSPGVIDPPDSTFFDCRKPLVGQFQFRGKSIFVILNHFSSRSDDPPLFGKSRSSTSSANSQRTAQALRVYEFVSQMMVLNPQSYIIVAGDFNDYQFSQTLRTATGEILVNVIRELPLEDRFTYIYDGNSQAFDHILVTPSFLDKITLVDIPHINTLLPEYIQASDHDPVLARFAFP